MIITSYYNIIYCSISQKNSKTSGSQLSHSLFRKKNIGTYHLSNIIIIFRIIIIIKQIGLLIKLNMLFIFYSGSGASLFL